MTYSDYVTLPNLLVEDIALVHEIISYRQSAEGKFDDKIAAEFAARTGALSG